jgi:hypothetical protein
MTGPAAVQIPKPEGLIDRFGSHPLIRTTAAHAIDLEAKKASSPFNQDAESYLIDSKLWFGGPRGLPATGRINLA